MADDAFPVLLDLDGTLVDSVYGHVLAWDAALREAGYDVPLWRVHAGIGMGGERLVPWLLGPHGPAHGRRRRGRLAQARTRPAARRRRRARHRGRRRDPGRRQPVDAEAAGRAGLRTIAVRCGGFSDTVLRGAGAVDVVDEPRALVGRL